MKIGTLEIIQIPAGEMNNFSYLLFCPATRRAEQQLSLIHI